MSKKKSDPIERHLPRRQFIASSFAAGTALSLGGLAKAYAAMDKDTAHRTVFCYLQGGWDMLFSINAREYGTPGFRFASDKPKGYDVIESGLKQDSSADPHMIGTTMNSLLSSPTNGTNYLQQAAIFNVSMNTNSHGVGRSYVNTGQKPSGSGTAQGDSIGLGLIGYDTANGSQKGTNDLYDMPSVSIGFPSYNLSGLFAQNTTVGRADHVAGILAPFTSVISKGAVEKIRLLEKQHGEYASHPLRSCVGKSYSGFSPTDRVRSEMQRARRILQEGIHERLLVGTSSDTQAFGINEKTSIFDPRYRAAVAGQLINLGVSRDVSLTIQGNLDTHGGGNDSLQRARQTAAFDAIAMLLAHLEQSDEGLQRTTVIISSEFSRTPKLNGGGGRDHWLSNAMIVIDPKLNPGLYGRIGQTDYLPVPYNDIDSSQAIDGVLRPEHVIATLHHAHSLSMAQPLRGGEQPVKKAIKSDA